MGTTAFAENATEKRANTTIETLQRLASVRDQKGQAISYYCTAEPYAARSHWEASAKLKNLINHATTSDYASADRLTVSNQLTEIVQQDEITRQQSPRFQAVFESFGNNFFETLAIPARGSMCRLDLDSYFHLLPLWQAIQASEPVCLLLATHGEVRCLTVRGANIEEMPMSAPEADLSPRSEGSFSQHIEGNVREREKRFLKQAAADVAQNLEKFGLQHLVIGCREEVLATILPILAEAGISKFMAGNFHLPNLDMGTEQIFEKVDKVMANHREGIRTDFWREIQQHPDRAAIGLRQTLDALQAGRVQKIVLGADACQMIGECGICGSCVTGDGDTCPSCASPIACNMAAGEYLLRKALQTKAEILSVDWPADGESRGVAALLRY